MKYLICVIEMYKKACIYLKYDGYQMKFRYL